MSHQGWGDTLAQTGCMEGQKRSALAWRRGQGRGEYKEDRAKSERHSREVFTLGSRTALGGWTQTPFSCALLPHL